MEYSFFTHTHTHTRTHTHIPGSGQSAIFQDERFNKRMIVLKKYVNMNKDLQLEVLYALQIAVAKLEHPPSASLLTSTVSNIPACITIRLLYI